MFAPLLRLLAFLYLVYCAIYFARSLLGLAPPQKGQRPPNPFGPDGRQRPPYPFDNFGPFGPFGPFGRDQHTQGQQRQYHAQAEYEGRQRRAHEPEQARGEPSPYAILGIAMGATSDEIRRAYQAKVREYHPDRTGSLPQELKELAERRTKEITNAYNQLKRSR